MAASNAVSADPFGSKTFPGTQNAVITGFNTDIEFEGVVYHVQTEDKGLARPVILSLVYDRGTILASKRSPYDDLIENFDEAVLSERLSRQHRLICAAIQSGRIEDLKRMSTVEGTASPKPATINGNGGDETFSAANNNAEIAKPVEAAAVVAEPAVAETAVSDSPIPKPFRTSASFDDNAEISTGEVEFDGEMVVPADAVEIVSELAETERPASKRLSVEYIGDSNFRAGERRTVSLMVCRGSERRVVADAQIMIKILGSSFRPLIFHAKTDRNGMASVNLQLPMFQTGRAAVLVRVINNGEEVELRRAVRFA